MPPKYNPLAVGQPQGIPSSGLLGQDFNTQMPSWEETRALQEALQAAELQNQQAEIMNPMLQEQQRMVNESNQLKLAEANRSNDYREALAAAIQQEELQANQGQSRADIQNLQQSIEQSRAENNLGPDEGPYAKPEFKPIETAKALDLAKSLAYETGNVDEGTRLESATRTARGDRLLTDAELAMYGMPEGSTLGTLRADFAAKRLAQQAKDSERRGAEADRNLNFKEKDAERKAGQTDKRIGILAQDSDLKRDLADPKIEKANSEKEYKAALKAAMEQEKQNQLDSKRAAIDQTRKENNLKPGEGPLADPQLSDETVDSKRAFELAQGLALDRGELDTGLKIQRGTKTSTADRLLRPDELQRFGMSEGSTISSLRADQAAKRLDIAKTNSDISKERNDRAAGRAPKGLSDSEVAQYEALDDLNSLTASTQQRYMPYISENRGQRFLAAAANPNSAAARMEAEMTLLTTQMAAAWNGKRLSNLDYETMKPLTEINALDTFGTVSDKLERLQEIAQIRRNNLTKNLEAAGRNVENFKDADAGTSAGAGGAGSSMKIPVIPKTTGLSAEEAAYKQQKVEENLARLRAGSGQPR